jgi:hypothetical protein
LHPEFGWQRVRAGADMMKFVTLIERGGPARSVKVEDLTSKTLRTVVLNNADTKSALMTDERRSYPAISRRFASHDAVNHSEEEWARKLPDGTKAHVNTDEGFFSIF